MAVRRVGHGLPEGRSGAFQTVMKLPSHPVFGIPALAA